MYYDYTIQLDRILKRIRNNVCVLKEFSDQIFAKVNLVKKNMFTKIYVLSFK